MPINNKGFTLIELAIVLVIIGLLVGGVIQGNELIHQSRIRSTIRTIQEVDTAFATFRTKYNNMPGDTNRATIFGLDTNTSDTDSTDPGEKNGDGDGTIESATGISLGQTLSFSGEAANVWVHLSNAQLIKGSYTQDTTKCTGAVCNKVGESFPALPVGTGIVAMSNYKVPTYAVGIVPILIPSYFNNTTDLGTDFTPEEAYNIDTKLDDGKPDSGIARYFSRFNGNYFVTGTLTASTCYSAAGGDYNVRLTGRICGMSMRITN